MNDRMFAKPIVPAVLYALTFVAAQRVAAKETVYALTGDRRGAK